MKKLKFKKIDAFATLKSDGNPAGYVALPAKDTLSSLEMLEIAKQLKGFVNEVGFIYKDNDIFDLKFYSSEREVDFCGHATIAIMYDIISNDLNLLKTDYLKIKTNKGFSIVENRILKENAVFIMSPIPIEYEHTLRLSKIAKAMNINESEINPNLPIKILNAGLTTLIIPIKTITSIVNIIPDIIVLKDFCIEANIDIIEVFTKEVAVKNNDYRVRVFAPTFGYLEDPATGSGNSAFGYYLIKNSLWNNETLIIEQNSYIDRYNIVKLQKKYDEDGEFRVLFGGGAITRIEGEFTLY